MEELVLIKLGGSLITDKSRPQTLRGDTLKRLAEEIGAARSRWPQPLLVGHGSGSFGHQAARDHDLQGPLTTDHQRQGVSTTQLHAAHLHLHVLEALHGAGARPFSLSPSSCLLSREGKPLATSWEPLTRALDLGLLPVVYGDVVLDRGWGAAIASTEAVLLELVRWLEGTDFRVRRALWFGDTDGILDADGATIRRVTPANRAAVGEAIGAPGGTDVTGGMGLRLETAGRLAAQGISSWILDGRRPGLLELALAGEDPGGTFVPAATAVPASRGDDTRSLGPVEESP
jgi:isopentenyl phosphate kinase